jgi:O-methyltransferase
MSSQPTIIKYKDVQIYQTPDEQDLLRELLREIKDIPGDIAEVGVFQGGSAAIIREEIQDKKLYLFDTFEGFADELHESDPNNYRIGDCSADETIVRELMKNEKDVWISKGKFPETAGIIKDNKFSFVHIDVDIYQATKNSLEFFYPRMNKGGIIVVHDFPVHPGVLKAVQEFGSYPNYIMGHKKGVRQLVIKI